MLPPGLAFVAYNDRALKRFKEVTTPRFYLNLNKSLTHFNKIHSFTPNVGLFRAVNAYAELIHSEGFENTIKRHYIIRDGLRLTLNALDLELLVEDDFASLR